MHRHRLISMTDASAVPDERETYSYLGPAGTFTEAALRQVEAARGQVWRPVSNVGEALADVTSGRSVAAMIAIENSIEGGVTASQDALATIPGLRIAGEYEVSISFSLVVRPGTRLEDVRTVSAHPVAYGQCRRWLHLNIPGHEHVAANSNISSVNALFDERGDIDAAIAPHGVQDRFDVSVLGESIQDNQTARTRFALVSLSRELPARTGADKTSLIVELPEEFPGSLMVMLEQFATRGVNLSMITSRPLPDRIGSYRFVLDLDGHIDDARVADALLGLRRFSPHVIFLGSYPRADRKPVVVDARWGDEHFGEAVNWLSSLRS